MKRSSDRILTTHTGSLPRPQDLLEAMRAKENGQPFNEAAFRNRARTAVAECVQMQSESGIDVVSDGELAKPGFFNYVMSRLDGLQLNPQLQQLPPLTGRQDFPEYQSWRATQSPAPPAVLTGRIECVGPLAWRDKAAVQADIDNLKDALKGVAAQEAFLPSASPSIVAQRTDNKYYSTQEAYVEACAEVMRDEYRAISGAGLLLQIDAPEFAIDRNRPQFQDKPIGEYRKTLDFWVEALNHALAGIPEEQVRFHVCWGNNEGPHTQDVPLTDLVDIVLKVHAGAYSVEASNPRHEHEWQVWKAVKLPDGKLLIPGVIDSTTNFVEHPELVAERIKRFADIVGKQNVLAGTDCGFGTGATSNTVYPPIVYAKLKAMADGAQIATKELWGR